MTLRFILAAAAAVAIPAAASGAVVQFAAPAGDLPAGRLAGTPFDAILPSGRFVTPLGTSVITGPEAAGLALSPDGRFAIVANAGRVAGESSLAVVDTATMGTAKSFAAPVALAFSAVAAVADPRAPGQTLVFAAAANGAIDVFDLDAAGDLRPDPTPAVLGGAAESLPPDAPPSLAVAPDGRRLYAIGIPGGAVGVIDPATRTLAGPSVPAGFDPAAAAVVRGRLLVSNEGLARYGAVANPPLEPPFLVPPADPSRASALSLLGLGTDGSLEPAGANAAALTMDEAPDGETIVGGAHPTAIAVTPDGGAAFVAMTGVDRIATVALAGEPHVAGGTELRLFDRGPYGTQPTALALSADGTRLYVALAGLDAVAVLDARDPLHLHRLGLIPTGAQPCALVLGSGGRELYVLNAGGSGPDAGSSAVASTLEKIDLGAVALGDTTRKALKNARDVRTELPHYPPGLRDVVVIVAGRTTFDALFGDLGIPAADPAALRYGEAVTPNLHALARRFGLAVNLYADGAGTCAAHQWLDGGIATPFALRAMRAGNCAAERPEVYPRAGYIFNDCARHGLSFRDYGELVRVAGYDDGEAADPLTDDPAYGGSADRTAPTRGLGGRYAGDVPAPAVLAAHIDRNFPGWNARIRSERRAREFVRDLRQTAAAEEMPRYTQIWLPTAGSAAGPDGLSPADAAADTDRAVGTVVEALSHTPAWKHLAIFIVPDGPGDGGDHVSADRTFALVVSPFARRQFAGPQHLSTVSVLKTAEGILGLPPLALGDLLATDMSDFFTDEANDRPFAALPAIGADRTQAVHARTGTGGPTPNETGNLLVRIETTNGIRGATAF